MRMHEPAMIWDSTLFLDISPQTRRYGVRSDNLENSRSILVRKLKSKSTV